MDAGLRLLARRDYDAISMAQIAREAGCSVGALYARYSDKGEYLYRVIGHAFRYLTDRAQRSLGSNGWQHTPGGGAARKIVSHLVSHMTEPRAAGVIRATTKLATVRPLAAELFENYRSAVTDLSAELLADKNSRASAANVRIGMQIVLGTITDAVLQKRPGAMNAGSKRMIDALANVLIGYLGLKHDAWSGDEADGEDEPDDGVIPGSETPPELEDGEIAIFDPGMRTYVGKRPGLRQKERKQRKAITANAPDMVAERAEKKAPTVKQSKPTADKSAAVPNTQEKQPSRSTRRRHRVV